MEDQPTEVLVSWRSRPESGLSHNFGDPERGGGEGNSCLQMTLASHSWKCLPSVASMPCEGHGHLVQ